MAPLAPKLQFYEDEDQTLENSAQDKTQQPPSQHSSKTNKTTLKSVYKEPIGDYNKKVDLTQEVAQKAATQGKQLADIPVAGQIHQT